MILSTSTLTAVTAAPSIVEDIDFLLGTDSGQYPLAHKLRNVNLWFYNVVTDILQYNSNWEWDDTNKTDYPIGTTNLIASQKDYVLPSSFLKILRVEVKDSAGNYQKVQEFDEQQVKGIGLSEFNKTDGLPLFYREIGNSIELYPAASASSTTLTSGLKVYYQRAQSEFTNADAAVAPGFAAPFHRILSLGAAYDYASVKMTDNPRVAANLMSQIVSLREAMKKYYASRNREVRPSLRKKRTNYE